MQLLLIKINFKTDSIPPFLPTLSCTMIILSLIFSLHAAPFSLAAISPCSRDNYRMVVYDEWAMLAVILNVLVIQSLVDRHFRNRCLDYAVTLCVKRNFRCLLKAIEQMMNWMMVIGEQYLFAPFHMHDFVLHYWYQTILHHLEMKHVLVVVLHSCLLGCHQKMLKQLSEWD